VSQDGRIENVPMRPICTLAVPPDLEHDAKYEGFWVVTRYEDILGVAQDWQTFSSAHGLWNRSPLRRIVR
jgi:cytochrome P450